MKREDFLNRLQQALTESEWEMLERNGPLPVSGFNRTVLLEMRNAAVGGGEVLIERAEGLYSTLRDYCAEHMAEQPAGSKYIILACLYLTFIAGRPMHPVDLLGIKVTETEEGTLYECPEKSTLKKTACDYCVCQRMSNYEITKRRMARSFAEYDQDKMAQRFQLSKDNDYLYIRFLNRPYQIHRKEGTVTWMRDGTSIEAGFNETMTLYDVLCNAKEGCSLSGEFVSTSRLTSAASKPEQDGSFTSRQAQMFDKREADLSRACEQLGGVKYGKGDVAYRLPLFDFLPAVLQFWSSDDEFPASLQLLWDKNILEFMHFETVWYAAGHLLDRLQELIG